MKENGDMFSNVNISEAALQSTVGDLAYVFEEERTIMTPLPLSSLDVDGWLDWKILEINQKEVFLEVEGENVSFIRDENCLGLRLNKTEKEASYVENFIQLVL